jgi:Clostripain family
MKQRLLFLCLGLLCVFVPIRAQENANWTILHYTNVDNNLEGAAFNDYYEMQTVGSGAGVNIVAQLDRAVGYDARFGDWMDTRRFYIEHVPPLPEGDMEQKREALISFFVASGGDEAALRQEAATLDDATLLRFYENFNLGVSFEQSPIEALGEVDMGESQALLDFILWGVQNYPAEHYMLVIGSHGAGWRGIGPDDGAGKSMLTLPEIDAALGTARNQLGIDKFDIVGFDACLMAVIDVALTLEPHADYILFSQEVIPSNGWEYTNSIAAMQAHPDWDAFQVGANFIDNYMAYYAGVGARRKVGLSLVETAGLPALVDTLQNFAATVRADPVELLSALGTARNNSQVFGTNLGNRAEFYSYIDLRDFMNWYSLQTTITEAAYLSAQEVLAAYDATVVYALADSALPNATGLALYLPSTPQSYAAYGGEYPAAAPESFAFWQDYLAGFYNTIVSELDGSALELVVGDVFTLSDTGSIIDTPVIFFDAAGKGVVDMSYIIFYQADDGSQIIVDTAPIAYNATLPTGETIIEYPNELTPSTFTWSVQMPLLSDGTNSVLALLQANSAGGTEGIIQGTYVSNAGNRPAYLVFDITTLEFLGVLAVDTNAPYEVKPLIGEQFVVDLFSVAGDGQVVVEPQADAPLTFGTAPLSLAYQPAPTGNYTIALSLSDLAGNVVRASSNVTVSNEGLDATVRGYTDTYEGLYFQYPLAWGESYVINNDDGSITNAVSDLAGENTIFVDAYTDANAQSALEFVLEDYGADAEISQGGFGDLDAYWSNFELDTETGVVNLTLISVPHEETATALVFTIQSAAPDELLTLLDASLWLFAPAQ